MPNDFITTIDSDDESIVDDSPPSLQKNTNNKVKKNSSKSKSKAKSSKSSKSLRANGSDVEDTKEDDGAVDLNPDFVFDLNEDTYAEVLEEQDKLEGLVKGSKHEPVSVDDIIARRKMKMKKGAVDGTKKRKRAEEEEEEEGSEEGSDDEGVDEEEESDEEEDEDEDEEVSASDDPLATSDEEEGEDVDMEEAEDSSSSSSADDSEHETKEEKAKKKAFFAEEEETAESSAVHSSFNTMNLSRPILKALTTLNFTKPTPIQAATIPVALLGKDIVGNAVTGSGKTAAFIIPVLERLLYRERGKKASAIRCVVLVPTRELAVQCYDVGKKLAAHTDIRFCLIVGGLSLKTQEAELRTRPDILIATPGRLIDHLHNSPSFGLDTLDILILDEADRMLSDGFADELKEIMNVCSPSRQVMLFSATMTDSVDELVKMAMRRPVRLFVDPKRTMAKGLVQEFVRVRERSRGESGSGSGVGKEGKGESERSAVLVALCKKTFRTGVIVFLRSKKLAHQLRIVFGILGMKCEELHGDLTQEQRLRALANFRAGSAHFLMATDLASRGLDIQGIQTVINYDMPPTLAQYLHRVGRTARAGTKGRAVTLVGEEDRRMLRTVMKQQKHHAGDGDGAGNSGGAEVRHRTVPVEDVKGWAEKLEGIKEEVKEVLKEEKEEKAMRTAEMEIKKGQNMLEHEKEIYSRPARTWFQSEKEKQQTKDLSKQQYENPLKTGGKKARGSDKDKDADAETATSKKPPRDKYAGLTRKAKRRKLAMEEDEDEKGGTGAMRAAIRSVKKAARPERLEFIPDREKSSGGGGGRDKSLAGTKKRRKSFKVTGGKGSRFERDFGDRKSGGASKARRSDGEGGGGKPKPKGQGSHKHTSGKAMASSKNRKRRAK